MMVVCRVRHGVQYWVGRVDLLYRSIWPGLTPKFVTPPLLYIDDHQVNSVPCGMQQRGLCSPNVGRQDTQEEEIEASILESLPTLVPLEVRVVEAGLVLPDA